MIPSSALEVVAVQVGELHPLERNVARLLCDQAFAPELVIDVVLATRVAIVGHAMVKAHLKLSQVELANLRERVKRRESIEKLTRELIDIRDVQATLGFKLNRVQHRRALKARQEGRPIAEIAAAVLRQPAYEAAAKQALPRLRETERAEIWMLNLRQLPIDDVVRRIRDQRPGLHPQPAVTPVDQGLSSKKGPAPVPIRAPGL